MEDNLISQSKQKASRQIPGSQTLCNDIADVLWCPLMLTCWGFVCVYAAGENNVSPGVFSLVGTWRRPMWKPLCSHVLISSVRNGLSLCLIKSCHGWLGFPLCARLRSKYTGICVFLITTGMSTEKFWWGAWKEKWFHKMFVFFEDFVFLMLVLLWLRSQAQVFQHSRLIRSLTSHWF